MPFDLNRVLKALLFAAPGPLGIKDIQAVFTRFHDQAIQADTELEPIEEGEGQGNAPVRVDEVPSLITGTQIREAMEAISLELTGRDEVYHLVETHLGWRLATTPESAEWARLLRNEPRPARLSQSALETLAIVAYRQPVTRAEVEAIRGVSADGALARLVERELIHVTGRADLPGRPLQYGTTEAFLEFVGVKSLEELPASDVLSPRDIDGWLRQAEEAHPLTEAEVGLPAPEDDTHVAAPVEAEPAGAEASSGEENVGSGEEPTEPKPPESSV
jgi:segregation and condensation protein B